MRELTRRMLEGYEPVALVERGDLREAAVLLLLYYEAGEEHVLFQLRTQRVRHHKGEISLPGGARDAGDGSLLATALRETHEEIGVAPEHVEVLGQLDDVATRSNYAVTAFVGAIEGPAPYPFVSHPREVEELLHVPLAQLRSENAVEWMVREVEGDRGAERSYRHGEHLIWGVTARIVTNYLAVLAGTVATSGR